MHTYLLLDRTGSMANLWTEALSSVNAYVRELVDPDDKSARVTLATFDYQEELKFEALRRNVAAENWRDITEEEAFPRGTTPLFDAVGQIVSLAESDAPAKAVIVIMTDGRENASRELDKTQARAALTRARHKGWQVVFLGADFDEFADAGAMGVSAASTMGIARGNLAAGMVGVARKSKRYASSGAPLEFDEADRRSAGEDDMRMMG